MREELDKKLVNDHPSLCRDRYGDIRKTCMCWGFTCGDGWYNIIEELFTKLDEIAPKKIVLDQVKEKFGGLRVYFHTTESLGEVYDQVDKLIDEAEDKSFKTCENCGESGKVRGGGWIRTLCDKCNKNR
jgi:hypothetical protein